MRIPCLWESKLDNDDDDDTEVRKQLSMNKQPKDQMKEQMTAKSELFMLF